MDGASHAAGDAAAPKPAAAGAGEIQDVFMAVRKMAWDRAAR